MHKTILGMINLIKDDWNRKLTFHVLKFLEKSIRKLAEHSETVDSSLIHSFFLFCQRMLFCKEQAQQKPPLCCVLFICMVWQKKSVLAYLG